MLLLLLVLLFFWFCLILNKTLFDQTNFFLVEMISFKMKTVPKTLQVWLDEPVIGLVCSIYYEIDIFSSGIWLVLLLLCFSVDDYIFFFCFLCVSYKKAIDLWHPLTGTKINRMQSDHINLFYFIGWLVFFFLWLVKDEIISFASSLKQCNMPSLFNHKSLPQMKATTNMIKAKHVDRDLKCSCQLIIA